MSTEGIFDGQGSLVNPSQIESTTVSGPDAVVDFFEVDVLIGENVADVNPVGVSANAAVATDASELKVGQVLDRG